MVNFNVGDKLWYANRDKEIVEECVVELVSYGSSKMLHCRNVLTGENFVTYEKNNCYDTFSDAYDNLRN